VDGPAHEVVGTGAGVGEGVVDEARSGGFESLMEVVIETRDADCTTGS
jgi:hypothetical protein